MDLAKSPRARHLLAGLTPLALTALLTLPALSGVTGCSSSGITDDCAQIAEDYCAKCFACTVQSDPAVTGAALCDLPDSITGESSCVDRVTDRCAAEVSAHRDPAADLEACIDDLPTLTCATLVERHALDQRPAPGSCQPLL